MVPWKAMTVLLLVASACSGNVRQVRLDTGDGVPWVHVPNADEGGLVVLDRAEFQEAMASLAGQVPPVARPQAAASQLFEVAARGGTYLYEPRDRRLIPLEPNEQLAPELSETEVVLTRAYLRWCERTGQRGDCLRLLGEHPTVTGDGRYALAMAFAQGAIQEEMLEAFKDMADPRALLAAALWTCTTYLILWTVPEPLSKGIAATMTAVLIAYLGVDTFWGLIAGFKQLVDEADRATTFEELQEAGESYGRVMGRNAARAFAMLATAAIGNTMAGFATKVPKLPGSAQAAAQAESQVGLWLPAVAEVETVALAGEGFTIALAPGATAMAAQGHGGGGKVQIHHIATNKNEKSRQRGGPWTPRFRKLFARAGMTLRDVENKVPIQGHKGPHAEKYHQAVHRRLYEATEECTNISECRAALKNALDRLAREIATPGTELNRLVTQRAAH
ncbi:AHH domain-containing protein [Pyxidicoccus xibeiensis]|uniref:AHH domain-containing protein n=1 Tax=Pyxidicoccus xibeiensis TaxID=2906759 RepID=UPI0020A7FB7A|nr:AHH domain-containing protein [Pyxidicoccus xibeiensis]MCP3143879.1 AHH domain-containing protein [Pyxidicoccus xibeiensis]